MDKTLSPWKTSQNIILGLSVIMGRCFSIIDLMLGPSGLYCVVNITEKYYCGIYIYVYARTYGNMGLAICCCSF